MLEKPTMADGRRSSNENGDRLHSVLQDMQKSIL